MSAYGLEKVDQSSVSSLTPSSTDCLSDSLASTAQTVSWLWDNHLGFAKATGYAVLPSQVMGPRYERSCEILEGAVKCGSVERMEFPGDEVKGIMLYPRAWDKSDKSQCVLFNNPNGVVLAQWFNGGELSSFSLPAQLMKHYKCPVMLYDYRGSGLSSNLEEELSSSRVTFRATAATVVEDGKVALSKALNEYQEVRSVGSSLGGGVATAAMEACLSDLDSEAAKLVADRLSLVNHDSFTTTGKVVLPCAISLLARLAGAQLDAETPMAALVQRGIQILVLCHDEDPVIPERARMAGLGCLNDAINVTVVRSPLYGHANLSEDLLQAL